MIISFQIWFEVDNNSIVIVFVVCSNQNAECGYITQLCTNITVSRCWGRSPPTVCRCRYTTWAGRWPSARWWTTWPALWVTPAPSLISAVVTSSDRRSVGPPPPRPGGTGRCTNRAGGPDHDDPREETLRTTEPVEVRRYSSPAWRVSSPTTISSSNRSLCQHNIEQR